MQKNFVISEQTRARCRIFPVDNRSLRQYAMINMEMFHLLYEVPSIDFTIFFQAGDQMVEFIRPEEFAVEFLQQLWESKHKAFHETAVCVRKSEYPQFLAAMSTTRGQKLQALQVQYPELSPRVLNIYDRLSYASQMVVRGGVDFQTAEHLKAAASALIANLVTYEETLGTLSKIINYDPALYDHSASVTMFASVIGKFFVSEPPLPQKELELLAQCALYHDIGKTLVPIWILNKPARLSAEEFDVLKQHTTLGYMELGSLAAKGVQLDPLIPRVALEHHEKMNGKGYPKARMGRFEDDTTNGIHLFSRIVAIADVYAALLMKRVYKPSYDPIQAIRIMTETAEADFDTVIFSRFLKGVVSALKNQDFHSGGGRILDFDEYGRLIEKKKVS